MASIKELREKANLTQKEFSNLTGIPIRTIQNWEQGISEPPAWAIELIEKRIEGEL